MFVAFAFLRLSFHLFSTFFVLFYISVFLKNVLLNLLLFPSFFYYFAFSASLLRFLLFLFVFFLPFIFSFFSISISIFFFLSIINGKQATEPAEEERQIQATPEQIELIQRTISSLENEIDCKNFLSLLVFPFSVFSFLWFLFSLPFFLSIFGFFSFCVFLFFLPFFFSAFLSFSWFC